MGRVAFKIKNKQLYLLSIAYFSLLWLFISICIPYTHDDWAWGTSVGVRQFLTGELNSRYAGNLIVVLLTRSYIFKSIFLGIVYSLIPIEIIELISSNIKLDYSRKTIMLLAVNAALLSMSFPVWQQTYGWISGASNYVVSALLLLFFLNLCTKEFSLAVSKNKTNVFYLIGYFFLGTVIQLFLEHLTVYITISTAILLVFYIRKYRRNSGRLLAVLIGNLIGLMIMFSSSIYGELVSTGSAVDGYRVSVFATNKSLIGAVLECIRNYFYNVLPPVFIGDNSGYSVVVLILLSLLLYRFSYKLRFVFVLANLIMAAFLIEPLNSLLFSSGLGRCVLSIGFALLVTIEILCAGKNTNPTVRSFIMYLWLSTFALVLPLCVIYETGPRIYITSSIIMIVMIALLLCEIINKTTSLNKIIVVTLVALTILLTVKWTLIYSSIAKTTYDRMAKIEHVITSNNDNEQLVLEQYNYVNYLWLPYPVNDTYENDFRRFYSIPDNVVIIHK